jgi:exosortase
VATLQAKAADPTAERNSGGGSRPWRPGLNEVLIAAVVGASLYVAYESSFRFLFDQWNRDPNYSYGFFVIPIAAVIFWSRRGMLVRSKIEPRWWPLLFLPLLAVVAVRHPLYEWNEQFIESATIPFVAAALVLAVGGWPLMRVAYPSLIFLLFMLPLPTSLNQWLARPLQNLATVGSVALLQLFGMPVMSEGNVIIVGATPLEVARACNGLSMLLSFVTLIAAVVILVRRPAWERVVLMLSAVPIALVSNILRITATAVCYHSFGAELGEKYAHDYAGWMMMPLALGLVWLELRLMSWVFQDVEDLDTKTLLRQGRAGAGAGTGPVVR